MSSTVIKVEGLHKKFCQSLKRSLFYGTVDATKSMFGVPIDNVYLRKKEFWALQDLNFELKRSETLGLIGQNGSGKTTLLRLINGIFPPDKGKITINGRIGALIAVGAGFHPHMTGRENIWLNGTILGMTKAELKNKFDSIVDFAEIGDFIDSPVATYSSGMTIRLGFAIAIHADIDILLVDEILAVGDMAFVGKCYNKIINLRENGVGIVVVSHNNQNLFDNCNLGLLLNYGRQILFSDIYRSVKEYELILTSEKLETAYAKENSLRERKKSSDIFQAFAFIQDINGNEVNEISYNDFVCFKLKINSLVEVKNTYITFAISNFQGICLIHARTDLDNLGEIFLRKGESEVKLNVKALNLESGVYNCCFVILNKSDKLPIHDYYYTKPLIIKGFKNNNNQIKIEKTWMV